MLRDYITANPRIVFYMDLHSYSELILSPWAYTDTLPPDAATFNVLNTGIQNAVTSVNNLTYTARKSLPITGAAPPPAPPAAPADGKAEPVDPITDRISHVFLFNYRIDQDPKPGTFLDIGKTFLPSLVASGGGSADGGSAFVLRSNLMVGGDAFVTADGSTDVDNHKSLFADSAGNVARPQNCNKGLPVIEKTAVDFQSIDTRPTTDSFLRYQRSGDTLALQTAGADGRGWANTKRAMRKASVALPMPCGPPISQACGNCPPR